MNRGLNPRRYDLKKKVKVCGNIDYYIFQSKKVKNWTGENEFYFIKHDSKYVGGVFDMYPNLHWYMFKRYRGMGLMKKALSSHILPTILKNKGSLEITIDASKADPASIKLAEALGFKVKSLEKHLEGTSIEYVEYNLFLDKNSFNEPLG